MTRESIEVTRQDRIYCLKASSDYHSELCEECRFYPKCDHMTQDDMTELTIKDLETLEQEPIHDILDKIRAEITDWQNDIHDNEYDAEKHDFVFERIFEIFDEYREREGEE